MRGFLSPGVDSDDWTVLGVLAAAARSVRREPVATLVWVGLVPALWSGVLFDWLWSHVVGGGPPFAVEVSDIAPTVLRALAASAWTSFLIGGKSVRAALRGSWELTNGQSWKIARLLLLYVPLVFLAAFIHGVPAGEVIALGSLQCFGTLTTVHLYLCLTKPAANTPVVSLPVVDDLPVRGSGWAKSVEPGEG